MTCPVFAFCNYPFPKGVANEERKMFVECENHEFTVRVTDKPKEGTKYLEIDFEWVGIKDNLIFLRKRN